MVANERLERCRIFCNLMNLIFFLFLQLPIAAAPLCYLSIPVTLPWITPALSSSIARRWEGSNA
jgi:hypothetical protein